ncbi:hypothetical protein ACWKWW_21920 [Chryseobacterium cucumeris]
MKRRTQACIIADEQEGRDYISLLLKNEFPETQVDYQTSSIEEVCNYYTNNSPYILFLDMVDKTKIIMSKTFHKFENQLSTNNFFRILTKNSITLIHKRSSLTHS